MGSFSRAVVQMSWHMWVIGFLTQQKFILMPLAWLLSLPLTPATGACLRGLVRRPFYWPNWQMMLMLIFFFFSPSFFAVITVILHGWRCTSTGSTLTADPFLFYFFKKKASIFFFIRMGMILLMSEVHFSQVRLKFTAWDWPSSTKTRGDEAVSG